MRMIFNKISISESGINAHRSQLHGLISLKNMIDDGVAVRNRVIAALQKASRLEVKQARASVISRKLPQDGVNTHPITFLAF